MRGRKTKTLGGSDSITNLGGTSKLVVEMGNAKGVVDSAWICGVWSSSDPSLTCVRIHVVKCSCPLGFMCGTHSVRSSCCARFVWCSSPPSFLCVPKQRLFPNVSKVFQCWSRPRMANRERNKKTHAERGNIKIVVANVTALPTHWPILSKKGCLVGSD